jgi:hypothetical protein
MVNRKLLQIMWFQFQMLKFFIYDIVAVLHYLYIINKKLRRCCQCDIMGKGRNILELGGSDTDEEISTKWNMNSEQCCFNVLLHKQCCNVATVAKCLKSTMLHMHMAHHKALYMSCS